MSELALKLIKEAKEKRLTRLDLGNCGLTELPDELFELVWLEELILSAKETDNSGQANNIKYISPKIEIFGSLKKIIANDQKELSDISSLNTLTQLQILDISYTKVKNLSALSTLILLHDLNVSNTEVIDLSPLKTLTQLQILDISGTQVNDLSYIIALIELHNLDVTLTQVNNLSSLKDLTQMQILKINYTPVSDLIPLQRLTQLEKLEAFSTQVINLNPLSDLTQLQYLNISNTEVSDLSPLKKIFEKGVHVGVGGIMIRNCPLTNPPQYIVEQVIFEQSNEAILRYWQDLENKETITNNQTKLIFVGNSRAGKTSLWQFLKDKIYNDQADSTHGIKTEFWDTETLGTEDNQNLAAHIWDFGGQEYYHATHRLFLADNAVYVLVWEKDSNFQGVKSETFKLDDDTNGEIEEVDLEHFPASYWLENIRYFGGKHCPVLIVQNKVDEDALKANYTEGGKNLPDCFHLSVKNAFEFQQGHQELEESNMDFQRFKLRLLKELRKNATAFKLVKYYAQVREALEAKAKNTEYIAVSELKDIALQFDETPDLENLLAYLKSFTNTVLYFPQNDVLRDRLYLNPTHISRDIYKILNKQVRENNGKFDVGHIKTRLHLNDDQEAERFVALMREFDLIFEKQDEAGKRAFVTPQYLPEKDKLSKDIQFFIKRIRFEAAFSIQFKAFVPRSLMLRFIANNGVLSEDETYWRNGIIYESPLTQSMIKVEYDHNQSTFTICVQDKQKQSIDMQNIVEQFVTLEKSDDNIKISNDGKIYFDLKKVRTLQSQNRKEIDNNEGHYTPLSHFNWLIQKQKTEINMALPVRVEELKEQVRNLIQETKTKEASDLIVKWAHENGLKQLKQDVTIIQSDLVTLKRQSNAGLLDFREISRETNRINMGLLSLIEDIKGEDLITPPSEDPTKDNDRERDLIENRVSKKLKILMLTANPTNQARLRLDSEHSNILQKLQEKQHQFTFVIKKGVSKSEFQELTLKEKPDILHFSGHGESAQFGIGGLILQDTDGKDDVLPANGLRMLFRYFKSENIVLKATILNACYSEEQAMAICLHVPYVIGTTLNIGDRAAIAFSMGFYYKLAENGTIEQAFNAGITRAAMDGADETYFALYKEGKKMPINF